MSSERRLVTAKVMSIVGFLVLLCVNYWLRSEVLGLSRIHLSAEEKRTALEHEQARKTAPERQKQYEVELKNYDVRLKHYERLMGVYQRDLTEYANLTKEELRPPQMPQPPVLPTPPEIQDELRDIKAEFVKRQYRYFVVSEYGNVLACFAALSLIGGLLYLLMFDLNGNRLFYFMTLALSFVFLIGPSLQSVLSAVIGLMNPPSS